MFGVNGRIAVNPKYLISRRERPEIVYGDFFIANVSTRELLEWMIMNDECIPFGQVAKWCVKNNPVLCIFDVKKNQEHIYSYNGGAQGIQMMLAFDYQFDEADHPNPEKKEE